MLCCLKHDFDTDNDVLCDYIVTIRADVQMNLLSTGPSADSGQL